MDLETAQTTITTKLSILKQENGNSFKPVAQTKTNVDGTSTSLIPGLVTTEEKVQKKNDVKARSMLLMALPNEHLMTFNRYKDAKTLFDATQIRFGGNEAIKKTQKTLLKQMYENFSAPSTESLDSIFNRLQKIVSQLAILGENISQEDLNLKFLRSLPSEWNTHVVVWRNKPDLDTMSFDDLYNNFKIIEQEVKGTASSSSSSQNMAFVSSPSSTNEVNTAYGVSTANTQVSPASTQVSTASTQVSTANLSDATVYAFLASQPNGSQLVHEDLEQIHEDDLEEMDLKWSRTGIKNNLEGLLNVEETSSKSMVAIDGASFDWSYMADNEVPTNMALMAFSDSEEFQQPEFEGYGPKPSKSVSEDISNKVRESLDAPLVEELVSDDKLEKKTVSPTIAKIEFVRPKQQEKPVKLTAITIKRKGWPKAVNTARPNSAVVNAVRANQVNAVKASAWNMSYLSDFKEFDGGYVTFRGGAKGGKITGKGTLKTADESQVLLKVLRKNNMYSVDMKNILPKESLTCLFAKATLDESMLWHRRLGHVNFKTINKLVKENLVRGLPTKRFENDQTCVACLKGKQHKASYDYSIFTWVFFLATKDETSGILKSFITEVENLVDKKVKIIRCDNGTEFKNRVISEFCEKKGIKKEFSVARTLQQNGVAERRNRTLIEAARTMFLEDKPIIASDGPKWLFDIDVLTKSMNYVLDVAVTNSNDFVGTEESIDAGHSSKETGSSQDYILMPLDAGKKDDEGVCKESGITDQEKPENSTQDVNNDGPKVDMSNITTTYPVPSTPNTRIHKYDSLDQVIGDVQSSVEPKKKVWTLVDLPYSKRAIGTKWVYKNKKDKRVARIEAIRLLLAYASFMNFVVYQMDMKSAFLYGKIEEEVYVCQHPGSKDPEFPNRVYKVKKALFVLHQVPRVWYETLSTYLLENGLQRGTIDKTLFIKKVKGDILLVQIYVDDVIFRSTKKELCTEFEKLMYKKFWMSSMGELTFFLGLQVMQKEYGIFISQDKYVDEILKKFGFLTMRIASTPMETSKPFLKDAEAKDVDVHLYRSMIRSLMYLIASRPDIMSAVCACARFQVIPKVSHLHVVKRIFEYLKDQPNLGLWYPNDSPFDLEAYSNSDYAGASLDRKSTTGGCQFLRSRLISWQCKKQTIVANSTTEVEYVATANCCGQVLWIQNKMLDYG
ncbi:putative ribonuclease H-like domain-containing protein [Tanacetum coccineum]|uniref:Ribonuclease H-like domain-containing protein n=1 Tax=Tanacetum coccineum TaxID=301880 RepID=A0ABQ4X7J0_9ASTR